MFKLLLFFLLFLSFTLKSLGNCGYPVDFNFTQSSCNANEVRFTNNTLNVRQLVWSFGDGQSSANTIVSHVYNTLSVFSVKLVVEFYGGCKDSVVKLIPVLAEYDNALITNSDTSLCAGNSVSLTAPVGGLTYCWFPSTGLTSSNTLNPIAKPLTSTTYFFTSQLQSANLVVNGDFSGGNTGFTSDYVSASRNTREAEYYIANDSYAWNRNFNSCVEHTTGTGNMMMVNGSSVAGSKVWNQNISITPNTNYAFSVWIESLAGLNPANLKFSINGVVLGDNIAAGNVACTWKQFYTTWNSGNFTTAIITIVNNNTISDGNDFAIDDISFSKVFMKRDSIRITVAPPPIIKSRPDTTICEGSSVALTTNGGNVYSWTPSAGLSDPGVSSPVATPLATTEFIVAGYLQQGCVGRDTVKVTVLSKPSVTLTNDTTICSGIPLQLAAGGGARYLWTPTTGLSSASIANPVATTTNNILYNVTVVGTNGCSSKDSVRVGVVARPIVSTIKDTTACNGSPVTFQSTVTGATAFNWSPSTGLANANSTSPVATPSTTTRYILTAYNSNCSVKDTVDLTVLEKPAITLTNDTSFCSGNTLQLNASGGATYQWAPSSGLSASNISNPIASPGSSTWYYVTATATNGCSSIDSVRLGVAATPTVSTINNTSVCSGTPVNLVTSSPHRLKMENSSSFTTPHDFTPKQSFFPSLLGVKALGKSLPPVMEP